MSAIRDKLTQKLSRFFADSQDTSSTQNSQVKQYSKGGRNFTSVFSLVVPLMGYDESKSDKQQSDLKPKQTYSFNETSKDFYPAKQSFDDCNEWSTVCCKDSENKLSNPISKDNEGDPVSKGNKDSPVSVADEYKDCISGTSNGDFDVLVDANSSTKYLSNLTDKSTFITPQLYEFLQSSLPNTVQGCQWVLLYSTMKHGISLRTLLRKSADLSGPSVLIVGDNQGAVFGGMLECPLRPTPKRKYQGTNQAFVFTTKYGEPRIFRPTGDNRYYYMCLNEFLAFGGGDNFALCLEEDLLSGTSGPCQTYGNLCLAHNSEFKLKNVELWGFAYVSKYLS